MKTEQDYIRKAVQLADGWHVTTGTEQFMIIGGGFSHQPPTQSMLDALAAQLVRQVDALADYWVQSTWERVYVMQIDETGDLGVMKRCRNSDRTMSTIKAIVDSGVLKDE